LVRTRPYVYVGIGVIAAAVLLAVGCSGQDNQDKWVTIEKNIFEVREMPERVLIYLDFGPVVDCAVHVIHAGNTLGSEPTHEPEGFLVLGAGFDRWEEGYQFRNCLGVKYTSDIDTFGKAAIEEARTAVRGTNWVLDVCERTGWVEYWKGYERLYLVPHVLEGKDIDRENVFETIRERSELADIECQRNEGRS
jgi:hypothetical protein